ncbi:MAG: cytochrome C oxidase subunit IV family protein [Candidatus Tectomicrobia bacterium]|nr:cytochrome C oxidase subunit IV family protein [Candidatus Tectomicrobia bacterium]
MSEHHRGPSYGSIWWWLLGLTIIEVICATQIGAQLPKVILLVGIALTKAALVALYFMHLRFERITLLVIAFTPMLICGFLVFMLMPDLGAYEHKSEIRAEQAHTGSETDKKH